MARDGSGNYSRVVTPPANGDVADADDFNSEVNDIATALSDSINKAGTKAFAADQSMGGFKLTNLAAPASANDAARKAYVDSAITAAAQPLDATLTALAAGATGADVLFYWSGSDTLSTTTLTSAARSILDDTTVAAICTTLGAAQLTANNTLSGTNTTTGQNRRHEAATPVEVTRDTGGGTNAKVWRRYASSGNLIFDCLNDAENSATEWLTVARAGQTPTLATFGVPVVTPFSVSSETSGTLSIASKNRVVNCSSGVTLPNSVFGEGQWQLLKAGSASRTITRGSGVAMYVNGTDSASATLSVRGLAGVYWESASACYLTGDVT